MSLVTSLLDKEASKRKAAERNRGAALKVYSRAVTGGSVKMEAVESALDTLGLTPEQLAADIRQVQQLAELDAAAKQLPAAREAMLTAARAIAEHDRRVAGELGYRKSMRDMYRTFGSNLGDANPDSLSRLTLRDLGIPPPQENDRDMNGWNRERKKLEETYRQHRANVRQCEEAHVKAASIRQGFASRGIEL